MCIFSAVLLVVCGGAGAEYVYVCISYIGGNLSERIRTPRRPPYIFNFLLLGVYTPAPLAWSVVCGGESGDEFFNIYSILFFLVLLFFFYFVSLCLSIVSSLLSLFCHPLICNCSSGWGSSFFPSCCASVSFHPHWVLLLLPNSLFLLLVLCVYSFC